MISGGVLPPVCMHLRERERERSLHSVVLLKVLRNKPRNLSQSATVNSVILPTLDQNDPQLISQGYLIAGGRQVAEVVSAFLCPHPLTQRRAGHAVWQSLPVHQPAQQLHEDQTCVGSSHLISLLPLSKESVSVDLTQFLCPQKKAKCVHSGESVRLAHRHAGVMVRNT